MWLVSLVGEFRRKQVRATSAAPRAPRSPATRARPSARRACTGAELWRRLRHALTAPILPTGRGVNGAVWGHVLDEHSSSRGSSLFAWGCGGGTEASCLPDAAVVVLWDVWSCLCTVIQTKHQIEHEHRETGGHRRALPRPASGAG